MSFDPDNVGRPGPELGHVLEDLKCALLTWSGSSVASPSDGAGRELVKFDKYEIRFSVLRW